MDFLKFARDNYPQTLELLRKLCVIPAPSGQEDLRAEACLAYMKEYGFDNAYIDEAKNVVCSFGNIDESCVAFLAHTDVVFPDTTPLPLKEDEEMIYCPGVGDDTACVVAMLVCRKYLKEHNIQPKQGLLFVANSGEEGLGNLKGCRQIFKDFGDRIKRMYAIDNWNHAITNRSVGSHRYRVTAKTVGGHSFSDFGNPNSIVVLAGIVQDIYSITVPTKPDSHTTYNVGTIQGGTSVNTIAQEATMLVEYRSDDVDCLETMEKYYNDIFAKWKAICPNLEVERVGERPCMKGMDEQALAEMTTYAAQAQERYTGVPARIQPGSTDCNIPHSLGIPSLCFSIYEGDGLHTREEWLRKESLIPGLATTMDIIMKEAGLL